MALLNANKPLSSSDVGVHPQDQSLFFTVLPAEIRQNILTLCVTDCEHLVQRYPRNCLWNRPGHYGPRTTYTDVLRACKRMHQESWFMPWRHTGLTIYLAAWDRRPEHSVNPFFLEEQLNGLDEPIEFDQVEVFAQAYMLEPGDHLQHVLDLPKFRPKRVSITLRHTDFWYWESDEPLRINAQWVEECRFPDSVKEVVVNFETLERKKAQADSLAHQAAQSWAFERFDGRRLRNAHVSSSRWTGSSTLNQQRWIRDESRPGELDYYIATITWKLGPSFDNEADAPIDAPNLTVAPAVLEAEERAGRVRPEPYETDFIYTQTLKRAKVPRTATPEEAFRLIHANDHTRRRRSPTVHADAGRVSRFLDSDNSGEDDGEDEDEATDDSDTQSDTDTDGGDGWVDTQVPATRDDDDEAADAAVIAEDRELDLYFLPGCPRSSRPAHDGRFGGEQAGYEYQFWRRRFDEWRRLGRRDPGAACDVREEMLPFWIPRAYAAEFTKVDEWVAPFLEGAEEGRWAESDGSDDGDGGGREEIEASRAEMERIERILDRGGYESEEEYEHGYSSGREEVERTLELSDEDEDDDYTAGTERDQRILDRGGYESSDDEDA